MLNVIPMFLFSTTKGKEISVINIICHSNKNVYVSFLCSNAAPVLIRIFPRSCSSLSTIKDTRVAVYTPELGATPLIHPARIRLDTPSYSLGVSGLEAGDTGTWYCRVDGRSNMVTAYNLKVTGQSSPTSSKFEELVSLQIPKSKFSFKLLLDDCIPRF